jgi:hypothetical protein
MKYFSWKRSRFKRAKGRIDRHDEVNTRIWAALSRCADQSLANTLYTNTTKNYIFSFFYVTLHVMAIHTRIDCHRVEYRCRKKTAAENR